MRSKTQYCQQHGFNYAWGFMVHPQNSSHLVPSDFQLSKHLKKQVAGKKLATDADVKQAVTSRLHTIFF